MEHFQVGFVMTFVLDVDAMNGDEAGDLAQATAERLLGQVQGIPGADVRLTKLINPQDILRLEGAVDKL